MEEKQVIDVDIDIIVEDLLEQIKNLTKEKSMYKALCIKKEQIIRDLKNQNNKKEGK